MPSTMKSNYQSFDGLYHAWINMYQGQILSWPTGALALGATMNYRVCKNIAQFLQEFHKQFANYNPLSTLMDYTDANHSAPDFADRLEREMKRDIEQCTDKYNNIPKSLRDAIDPTKLKTQLQALSVHFMGKHRLLASDTIKKGSDLIEGREMIPNFGMKRFFECCAHFIAPVFGYLKTRDATYLQN